MGHLGKTGSLSFHIRKCTVHNSGRIFILMLTPSSYIILYRNLSFCPEVCCFTHGYVVSPKMGTLKKGHLVPISEILTASFGRGLFGVLSIYMDALITSLKPCREALYEWKLMAQMGVQKIMRR